jgi:Na+-transporting NADH:ubiquinone oxidoreductase subunit C
MSSRLKSLVFASVLCLVISVLLTTASIGLQRYQEQNVLIDKHKNILKSIGLVEEDRSYDPDEIERLYAGNIKAIWVDSAGRMASEEDRGPSDLPLYVYMKQGKLEAYVIPINSRGLWGRILGYLALESDGSTVAGFTVYKHSETPGLGGEIETAWFQKNWVGKKIVNRGGQFVSIGIAKGDVEKMVPADKQPNYVDGISGATLTGKYLSAGIREILETYEPVSVKLRNNPSGVLPAEG